MVKSAGVLSLEVSLVDLVERLKTPDELLSSAD